MENQLKSCGNESLFTNFVNDFRRDCHFSDTFFLTTRESCVFIPPQFTGSMQGGQNRDGNENFIQQLVLVLLLLCTGLPDA